MLRFFHRSRLLAAFALLALAASTAAAQQDVQKATPQDRLILPNVFHLQAIPANDASVIIQNIFDDGGIRVAVDARTNTLIVSGDEETLQKIEAVLENIDAPAMNPVPADGKLPPVQVRVYWLTTDSDGKDCPGVLLPVLEELEAIGFNNISLGGQMAVNVGLPGKPFTVSSAPRIGVADMNFQFQGQLGSGPNNLPVLNVELDLTTVNTNKAIARIETSIEAPLNQFVVLGTTTAGGSDSMFVIQLVPQVKPATQTK